MVEDIFEILKKLFKKYEYLPKFNKIPEVGFPKEKIIELIKSMIKYEDEKWKEGLVSGCVYHGDEDYISFLSTIYSISSQVNPLHPDVWPSVLKFEKEIIEMSTNIFHGNEEVCGSVTSGGTESIFLAMKAYRDYAKKTKGIIEPEIILPVSAHAAFDKSAQYLGIKQKYANINENFEVDVEEIKNLISDKTIAIIASAPCFPYGTMDPIKEISDIALDKKIPLHVDACLGGFILPWAKKLGYNIRSFDFELEGVTSLSADLHKYGFSPKGVSVILYRNPEIWKYQFYINTKWCGGIYFSTTFQGSRPGALLISAWAAMLYLGEEGYLRAAKQIFEVADFLKNKLKEIKELKILGNPLFVIAISSDSLNIYNIAEQMSKKGWNLNLLMNPPAFHLAITLRHNMNVAKRFIEDLINSVEDIKLSKEEVKGLAPIYGMMASLPSDTSEEFLSYIIQWLYKY